ncbi:heparinase II/III family protein [uncultured Paludibaculum sp.]|uniref:heparinase II/III domain-containing protein n=1 Tax=uncultured Paludibaculum sp. TaxID=1765020 RepID=UPI002AAAE290|nr:heparinase II/III family protein [uncultured Paludibaculum sp.]
MAWLLLFLLALPLAGEPRLLLNRDDIARIRAQASAQPVVERLLRQAEDWPKAHVDNYGLKEWALPSEGAGWSHAYVCPVHGARLKQSHGQNLCPVDGKDYHGWPVDNVVYMQRNGDNAAAVRDLGLAYLLSGRAEFAAKARRILNAYTALYPTLPIHDNNNKLNTQSGARVMSQTLSEASWLVPLVFGYDLVRDTMTAEERAGFERDVLRNAAAILRGNDRGKSNWQSWHNCALLAIGLTVSDQALVDGALGSFKFQMKESITPDGPWFEGSWGYHFFSVQPLMLTIEMARRAGLALPEASAFRKMLDAPLRAVFPDGTLPNFNDSGMVKLATYAKHYSMGYRMFGESRYVPLARQAGQDLETVLWGAPVLPDVEPMAAVSDVMPDAGLATLRVRENDHVVAVKFGPHGGGHGHFDKLTFNSYWNGAQQAADPGTQAYAAPSHTTWDKMTIAHNTVTVDEKPQAAATGKLLEWVTLPSATAIRVSAGPAYEGIEMERTFVHTALYTLDLFDVRATDGVEHQFDWIYHNYGRFSSDLRHHEGAGMPKRNGYQHLAHTTGGGGDKDWIQGFYQEDSGTVVRMLGAPSTSLVEGEGLGPDLQVPVPFVVASRRGVSTRFEVLFEPKKCCSTAAHFSQLAKDEYLVDSGDETDHIHVEPGRLSILHEQWKKPVHLILAGIAEHELLRRSQTVPIQVDWSADGATVDLFMEGTLEGAVRITAPAAKLIRLNGRKIECRADGPYRWASLPNLGNLEPCQ